MICKKNISVLGSTGSVGRQCLEVIKELKKFKVIGLSAGKNIKLLETQIIDLHPKYVCVSDENDSEFLKSKFNDIVFFHGNYGLKEIAKIKEADVVFNSVSGFTGLYASIGAAESGKTLALANKETIVAGGSFFTNFAKENGCNIHPVDSEHSAIWQCIDGKEKFIKKIILTASGGPFFGWKSQDLQNVKIEQVLKHPTWNMGEKISVDSATMVNKGLEIIEAVHLFGIPESSIEVLIHPESIVHSLVEFVDGAIIAQMSVPSMKFPIQYALTYPERVNNCFSSLDLSQIKNLSFYAPDRETNEFLDIFRKASYDNYLSCSLNSINESVVNKFLNSKIQFTDIKNEIKSNLKKIHPRTICSFEDIINCHGGYTLK